jgi:hypothetical protein
MGGQHYTLAALHPVMTLYQFYRRLSNIIKLLKYERVFNGSLIRVERTRFYWGNMRRRHLAVEGRIILRYILSK